MAKAKAKKKKDPTHATLFVPIALRDAMDANAAALGLKSRTEAVRMGQHLLTDWIEFVRDRDYQVFDQLIARIEKGVRISELLEAEPE